MKDPTVCDRCPWHKTVLNHKKNCKVNKHFWRRIVRFDMERGWIRDEYLFRVGDCGNCPYELEHLMSESDK